MGTLTKVFVILNLIFGVAYVTVSAQALQKSNEWRVKHGEVQAKLDQLTQETTAEIDKLKKEKDILREEGNKFKTTSDERARMLQDLEVKVTEKEADILKAQTELANITEISKTLSANVDNLTKRVEEETTARKKADEEFAKVVKENDSLNSSIASAKKDLAVSVARIGELSTQINDKSSKLEELKKYQDVVSLISPEIHEKATKGEDSELMLTHIKAVVKSVDQETGIVILNVGTESVPAVKKGNKFLIYRGNQFVAAVKVINVEKKMSAAEIIPPTPEGSTVNVGDDAITEF